MNPRWILVISGCAAGTAFVGGSLAGIAGALIGTLAGIVLGIVVWKSEKRNHSR